MNIYTAHTKPLTPPELVREGFAWGGLVFGPLWLLARGGWVAGSVALLLDMVMFTAAPAEVASVLAAALSWLIGLFGYDLRRWALGLRGYHEVHVIAARDPDSAFARLLDRRPDLIETFRRTVRA